MQRVVVSRTFETEPEAVCEAMMDIEPFMRAAGFDGVRVDGELIEVENSVGIATIELTLEVVDNPDADLAYEQQAGIFETMRTDYTVEPSDTGSEVRATTDFELDISVVGEVLDATVIKRQRQRELEAQLDWIQLQVG